MIACIYVHASMLKQTPACQRAQNWSCPSPRVGERLPYTMRATPRHEPCLGGTARRTRCLPVRYSSAPVCVCARVRERMRERDRERVGGGTDIHKHTPSHTKMTVYWHKHEHTHTHTHSLSISRTSTHALFFTHSLSHIYTSNTQTHVCISNKPAYVYIYKHTYAGGGLGEGEVSRLTTIVSKGCPARTCGFFELQTARKSLTQPLKDTCIWGVCLFKRTSPTHQDGPAERTGDKTLWRHPPSRAAGMLHDGLFDWLIATIYTEVF